MQLKDYQDKAIEELKYKLYKLWKAGHAPARLVFKAPTGAGKTIMAAELLNRISGDAQFDPDKAFIWISFNPDSVEQSRQKLAAYLNGGIAGLYDTDEISQRGKLKKNDVLFVNWQKLNAHNKESRKLHRTGEATISFETFIANTKADEREIIVVIDECQLVKKGELAGDTMRMISPRIEVMISATPLPEQLPLHEDVQRQRAEQVTVDHADVVASGILKRTVHVMPREEIDELIQPGRDLDQTILDLAAAKRLELAELYRKSGAHVNPLVLIKLPNDDAISKAADGDDKLAFVRRYLADMGVPDSKIAVWLTAKKENLASITDNESPIEYLIFKQAAATGWDCPRADVLVMFREIKSPVFETQVIGRVLRTAEGKHYPHAPPLDDAWLYTSYERKAITDAPARQGPNSPKTNWAIRKPGLANVALPSTYISRADYNDLGDSFQDTFSRVADVFFAITAKDSQAAVLKKLDTKGLDRSRDTITNKLIVDANIEVFDDFLTELAKFEGDLDLEASRLDLQKLYTTLLWKELALQDAPEAKYNAARSWSPLKSALNIYFRDKLKIPNPPLYAIICNDLLRAEKSALRPLISQALSAYRLVRTSENAKKAETTRHDSTFSIRDSYVYDDTTPPYTQQGRAPKHYALDKAYIAFDSDLERQFCTHLDAAAPEWWFKNGAASINDLGIPYTDDAAVERVFYPDFIVRQGKRVGIFDTKSGLVAKDATAKAEALAAYIKRNTSRDLELWGGIVTHHSGLWKIHSATRYSYTPDMKGWQPLKLTSVT